MILKSADDKSKRLMLLQELQHTSTLNSTQKKWLREELMRTKKGIQGERESAYYLDNYFKDQDNRIILHDLRFVVDGEVTQIDHLIINQGSSMYLLETKNYACNLVINEHGEFTAEYENARFGIPSPIEQSLRHERVLTRMLERLGIAGRTQKQLDIHHVVMLHPKATIERPAMKSFDTGNIIKADQFPTWHKNFMESIGVGKLFKTVLNLQNVGTIKEWGERLLRQHRPDDLLALPDFMRPSEYPPTTASTPRVLSSTAIVKAPPHQTEIKTLTNASPFTEERARRLVCARCAVKISFAEGKFCWNNSKRFGGLAYCREHHVLTN